jgi:maltooligosyltrehalose synthase
LPSRAHPDHAAALLSTWKDGHVKFFVTKTALTVRHARREAFLRGGYTALDVTGQSQHIIAFEHGECITLAPRLVAPLLNGHSPFPIGEQVWRDSTLVIPPRLQGRRYVNAFTGESFMLEEHVKLGRLLEVFPVALLVPEDD